MKVAKMAQQMGSQAMTVQADVSNETAVSAMINDVVAQYGHIDILVNNAGIVVDVPFSTRTTDQWRRTLDVNLNGTYYCAKYAIPHLLVGGSIINISSTNAIDAFHPNSIDYDVSKAGTIMFTKSLARELAPKIRVNCIAPGWSDTDINADLPADYIAHETRKIAMGTFGDPAQVASVAAFLASQGASYMTGSVVVVDGGYSGWAE